MSRRDRPGRREGLHPAATALVAAWVRAKVEKPDSMFRADSVARRLLELHDLTVVDVTSNEGDLAALLAYLRAFDPGR